MRYKKGNIPWIKGKKHSVETRQKMSLSRKEYYKTHEHPKGNLGRNLSLETRKKMSRAHKGKIGYYRGKHRSDATKKKISEALKGEKNHNYHKIFSQETRQKIREARLKQILPKKDTSIEIILQKELNQQQIKYEKHIPVCSVCQPDIVFPKRKIAVFCDGDYWHNLPYIKRKDTHQNKILTQNGWHVFRFSGTKIRSNPRSCVNQINAVMFNMEVKK